MMNKMQYLQPRIIIPTPEQIAIAWEIADTRNAKAPITNRKMTQRPDREIHFEGGISEVCFADRIGGSYDTTRRDGGDKGAADVLLRSLRFSIKSSPPVYLPVLKINSLSELDKADYFVFCQVHLEPIQVAFFGYVSADEYRTYAWTHNYGHGTRYCVDLCHHIDGILKEIQDHEPPDPERA